MIVFMIKYLQKFIDDLPGVIHSTSTRYTAECLFTVQDEKKRKLFPDDQAQHFNHIVAHLLFLCMGYFPDIQPLVAFLTMIVRSPEKDDWGKLKQG